MFRLIRFAFRIIVALKIAALAMGAGMAIAYGLMLREEQRTWGLGRGDAERSLPGDDLVDEPILVETRSLHIDAGPAEVWPWLVQLGYGRGGWYSYPQLDRPWSPAGGSPGSSAETILEQFQDLAEGDVVPTHREGGFVARVVDPGSALVLYIDDVVAREQLEEMAGDARPGAGGMGGMDVPPFRVSWAFVLEPMPGRRVRLVERMRVGIALSEGQRRAAPLLGLGVFAIIRRQMLGIKERAERGSSLAA